MAEETLVKEVLTDSMIAAGRALTDALEQRGWLLLAAFWLYDWETNRWKLMFASPVVEKGVGAALDDVCAALDVTTPAVRFAEVDLVSPDDPHVRALLRLATGGLRLDGKRIRSGPVEDSYVYRVRPTASVA